MKDHWYCRVEGQQYGPYTWDQMRAMAAEGRLVAPSDVRREADQRWSSAGKIPGLLTGPMAVGAALRGAASVATAAPPMVNAVTPESTCGPELTSTVIPADAKGLSGPAAMKIVAKRSKPIVANQGGKDAGSAAARPAAEIPPPPRVVSPLNTQPALAPPPTSQPPVPPPASGVAAKAKSSSLPIPTPAEPDSPLGIVVPPPVAPPSKAVGKIDAGALPLADTAKRPLSPLVMAGAGGGILLLFVIVGAIAWNMTRSAAPKTEIASADGPEAAAPPKPLITDAELDAILGKPPSAEPAKPAEPMKTAAPANEVAEAAAAKPAPPDPKLQAAKTLIERQKNWSPVASMRITNRSARLDIQIAAVWLAADAKGTFVDPVLPPQSAGSGLAGAASTLAASSAIDSAPAKAAGKFVFVEVRVTNGGELSRKYTSWNTGDPTKVILADDANQPLSLVPIAETPEVTRQTSLHIPPGQTIRDLLVFRAPARPFESLKLLLAQSVLTPGQRGYFPVEVPVEFLFKQPEPLVSAADGSPQSPASAKPRDPNAPPNLDDFTKSLEHDKKIIEKRIGIEPTP